MLRKTFVTALAAASFVAVPAMAMAAQTKTTTAAVNKLSVRSAPAVRQAATVSQESKLRGAGVIISLVAVVGIIAVIVIVAGGKDKSASPS